MWVLKVSACVWRGYSVLWTRRMGDYSCCCVLVKFAPLMNARQLVGGTTDEVIAGCAMREEFPRTASRSSTCLSRLPERLDKQARHVPPPSEHNTKKSNEGGRAPGATRQLRGQSPARTYCPTYTHRCAVASKILMSVHPFVASTDGWARWLQPPPRIRRAVTLADRRRQRLWNRKDSAAARRAG